jgi:protein-disulfide isomerase
MSKESKGLLAICLVVAGTMIGLFALVNKTQSSNPTASSAQAQNLVRSDSYTFGTGPIIVVEFADFQCPACAVAAPDLLRLKTELKDRIKVVFRHFPLPSHRNSQISAQAAEAAGEQGKFWEMYELLYSKQLEWSDSIAPLNQFKAYAGQLGLDVEKFSAAVTSSKFQAKIERDLQDATALGVNATPTLYVDGQKISQFPSYQVLKAAVESSGK